MISVSSSRRRILATLVTAVATAATLLPAPIASAQGLPARQPDLANGKVLFTAGGCASCHATPGQSDMTRLGGGLEMKTGFGTFHVPNISPDKSAGIGGWTEQQVVDALRKGVGRNGEHLYPVFPYTTYQRLRTDDARDLYAYLMTLPADPTPNKPHQLSFPYNVRLTLAGWKLLYLDGKTFTPDPARDAQWNRGAYLVEAAAHCAECHSTRNALGAIDPAKRYAGGPDPERPANYIPNITQHADGIEKWTVANIAELLKSGYTPDDDKVSGTMAEVVKNTVQLSEADRVAMATYLKSLPPLPGKAPPRK